MVCVFLCFKRKTADEMRSSYWSSDVCSSDLGPRPLQGLYLDPEAQRLQVAAYDDHAPAEYADRDPDSQPADARAVRIWAGRALGVQAGRQRSRRAGGVDSRPDRNP